MQWPLYRPAKRGYGKPHFFQVHVIFHRGPNFQIIRLREKATLVKNAPARPPADGSLRSPYEPHFHERRVNTFRSRIFLLFALLTS